MRTAVLRACTAAWLLCAACLLAAAQSITPVIAVSHGPNAPAQRTKHYVVLVSLDGFRYDYARRDGAKNLLALAARGATAPQGMIPAYPSLTFPNHYTLVTGLYPEHHGIVANSFYDPARREKYSYMNAAAVTDGSWYSGTPLWTLAEKQGMRTACFFWPGSEAEIGGERPTYYLKYDSHIPDPRRVDQVLAWLRLPAAERPHFITLYFSAVDHAGHRYGPDSEETAAAVRHLDQMIGHLEDGLQALSLPVDLIVVSDHGMANEQGGWIDLSQYADLRGVVTDGDLLYPKTDAGAEKLYEELRSQSGQFRVYRRAQVPAGLHYRDNPREGDPVVVANGPYPIHARQSPYPPDKGMHGFDPGRVKQMRALFIAAGPDIRAGVKLEPFENVNVYPLIAALLGLEAPKTDGKLSILSGILRHPE